MAGYIKSVIGRVWQSSSSLYVSEPCELYVLLLITINYNLPGSLELSGGSDNPGELKDRSQLLVRTR